ncbi:MAG: hypothetical protein LQ340_004409 [Diploschistes diacapsis]|nr:MAG: hypothetical protein LQ340_004409 [Diploschistes diacapsis]
MSYSQSQLVDSVNSERGSAYAPIRKFSDHRAPITGLAIGSSSINTPFAISSSKDSTCIVWDYKTGEALRIFLLHSPALSIVADPAERAFYAGLDDGSIQKVNFLQEQSHLNRITLAQNPPGTLIQAPNKQRWQSTTVSKQPILTLDLSFDGTLLLSGHQDGKIHVWDVAKGRWDRTLFDHATSVTNIFISPPIGLANECAEETKSISALKPKLGGPLLENHNNAQESIIPREYQYSAYFAFELVLPRFRNEYGTDDLMSDFEEALNSSIQPRRLFEEGLQALHTLSVGGASSTFSQPIDHAESSKGIKKLQDQLDASRKLCEHTSGHMDKLSKEVQWFRERERSRERMKKLRRMEKAKAAEAMRKKSMGETTDDNDMVGVSGDNEDMQGASSTTEISSHSA